ncbi:hypothetical protein LAJ57_12735, partial [Streptococcus pneumoniae]|uniref:hypothetical protein n=1 Tax=Streptococcus pneumoniae TaxID=1313 RepID=UPI001CBDFA84
RDVPTLRANIKKDAALESSATRFGNAELAASAKARKEDSIKSINQITVARQLLTLGQISDALPPSSVLFPEVFKAGLLAAQQEAMKAVVQRVS